jgi:hypothetical protein
MLAKYEIMNKNTTIVNPKYNYSCEKLEELYKICSINKNNNCQLIKHKINKECKKYKNNIYESTN